jgi:asparagine synthase (glutamine-hydrolysing)
MCGIAGIIWPGVAPYPFVEIATSLQSHRGPDSNGTWTDTNMALVHNRLSIVDLEGGGQPMENKEFVLVFNGEIYNHDELRRALQSLGYSFETRSDTEVVLHGFQAWGTTLFPKLRGMFALAVFNKHRKILTLARDSFGIKPLHYFKHRRGFAFASELSVLSFAFKSHLHISTTAIAEFMRLQFIPSPQTIFKEIHKLEAGSWMQVDFNGKIQKQSQFSSVSPSNTQLKKTDLSYEEATQSTRTAIKESVSAHLMADVELGTFLSGGIDSTLITQLAAELTGRNLHTFSIGFSDSAYDESSYARLASQKIGTQHHALVLETIKPEQVESMVASFGEPFGDSSAIPSYFVAKLAANHVKVVLTGDGGDELFFGYSRFLHWLKRTSRYSEHSNLKKRYVHALRKLMPNRYGPMSGEPVFQAWAKGLEGLTDAELNSLFLPLKGKNTLDLFKAQELWFQNNQFQAPSNLSRLADLHFYLRDDLLTKVDICTMRNSIEARPPFLDLKLWDWVMQLPEEYLFDANLETEQFSGKKILKSMLVPDFGFDFVHRPKMGFSIPLDAWLNRGGPLESLFADAVCSSQSVLGEWFDGNVLVQWQEQQKKADSFNVFGQWSFLVLAIWLNQWKQAPTCSAYA